ncbi:MAG: NTP transferase domain-containing protein [Halobacteriales archaeon]
MTDTLPLIDPAEVGDQVRAGSVHGVLLAAGDSQRYGDRNKLLVEVDGVPMVRRAAEALTESAVESVFVVLGYEADAVATALDGLEIEIVENPAYHAGQATSLRAGTRAAREAGAAAVCYALGDMPWVQPGTVDTLIEAYLADRGDPLAAAYEGNRGNPTLFDARHFEALEAVDGDTGGREILLGDDRAAMVATGDPGVRRDVDTPDDHSPGST